MMDRQYDIVLLGATGYTGRLAVEYMAHSLPPSIRWAIAGRSGSKLEAVSKELGLDSEKTSIITLDLTSPSQIAHLAKSTRVLISVIGPYVTTCGETVIQACAENGTDYVDCAGEMPWIQEMIAKHHSTAEASGAKLIVTSGWGAVPADLTTYLAARHIRSAFSLPTREVLLVLSEIEGSFSGGSINSLCALLETYGTKRLAEASAPFQLAPKKRPSGLISTTGVLPGLNALGVQTVPGVGTLVVSTQEQIERGVIGRSWGLVDEDEGYGPNFSFSSRMRMSNALTAVLFRAAFLLLNALLTLAPLRQLVTYLVPAGTGPSATQRRGHYFKYRAIGIADTEDALEKKIEVSWEYDGDPYVFTGVAMVEAAVTLLEGGTEAHRKGGGILTPAMLGEKYVERLKRPEAGVRIEVKVME